MALTNATTLADYSSGIGTQGATLKVDANNQRVGIGTLTPTETLDVVGNMAVEGDISVTGTLSYEDLTNVDAIGYSTFRSGINVQGAGSTTTTLNVTGVSTFQANVDLGDDDILRFGAGQDLQIYHDSATNNSYIKESGSGRLEIRGSNLYLTDEDGTNMLFANNNAGVSLYYGGGQKFETTTSGVVVTGICTATSFSGDGSGLSGVSGYNDLDNALFG